MGVDAEAPCCVQIAASPIVGWGCSIPLGGIIGLAASGYAQTWFALGTDKFEETLQGMGLPSSTTDNIGLGLDYSVYLIVITNVIITLYGFREKCRIRNDILGHVTFCCIPSLIKCLVKSVIHMLSCVSLLVVLILAFVLEGIYVLMLAIDGACSGGQDAVVTILDLIGGDSESVIDTCETVKNGKVAAFNVFVGSLCLVVSQIIIICYWYKYSTLAMVTPFYGEGSKYDATTMQKAKKEKAEKAAEKQAKKDAKSGKGDVEMGAPAAVPQKAPRKV